MDLRNYFKSKQIQILILSIGALGGFIYWKFVGCNSGTCPIKSVWYLTTLWGAVLGFLIGDIMIDLFEGWKFKKRKKSEW